MSLSLWTTRTTKSEIFSKYLTEEGSAFLGWRRQVRNSSKYLTEEGSAFLGWSRLHRALQGTIRTISEEPRDPCLE